LNNNIPINNINQNYIYAYRPNLSDRDKNNIRVAFESLTRIKNKNVNNNPNNNVNLEEEIKIKLVLSEKNNIYYEIKAKLNEKIENILKRVKDNNGNTINIGPSALIFNTNYSFIDRDKNLFENEIKNGDKLLIKYLKENNHNSSDNLLSKEEKEIVKKWGEEYRADKYMEYLSIMLTLPEGQSPPNFNDLIKKEEIIEFLIERDKDFTLKVKEHKHKLLKSLTRSKWKCNVCNHDYDSNQPTFLCSLCDYNMCDNCRKKGNYEEKISFPVFIIPPNELIEDKFIESKYHEHRLAYCRHIHRIFGPLLWKCKKCKNSYEKEIWSFSCTVCNYDFCFDCIFE
jgi:hypothetical protein